MSDMHQGYTNYATFGVAVTLANTREYWRATGKARDRIMRKAPTAEQVLEGTWTEDEYRRFTLADWIRDYVERLTEMGTATPMTAQMVQAGLAEVDWEDVAAEWFEA